MVVLGSDGFLCESKGRDQGREDGTHDDHGHEASATLRENGDVDQDQDGAENQGTINELLMAFPLIFSIPLFEDRIFEAARVFINFGQFLIGSHGALC